MMAMVLPPAPATAGTTAYKDTLEGLDLSLVQFLVIAPPELTDALRSRGMALFAQAGLSQPGSQASSSAVPVTLTLSLDPQPIGGTCPGMALYAPSLTLTEPVAIPRNGVVFHDATWLVGNATQVSKSIERRWMEEDLDGFINQFIADYREANAHRRPQDRREPSAGEDRADRALQTLRTVNVTVLAGRHSPALKRQAEHQLTEAGFTVSSGGAADLSIELLQQPLGDQCPGQVLYDRGIYLVEPVQLVRRPRVSFWTDTWYRAAERFRPLVSQDEMDSDMRQLIQDFIRSHAAW
jgi:hypothetical protein